MVHIFLVDILNYSVNRIKQMQLKICGMKNPQNIADIAALNPDYLGFIFYEKSKRYVDEYFDKATIYHLPKGIKNVL